MAAFDTDFHLILENERVRLDPLEMTHLVDLLPICEQWPDLLKYSPSPFGTVDLLKDYIDIALRARVYGNRYPFSITDKSNGEIVGSTSYGSIALEHKRIEIGWTWISPNVQGSGLNKEMKHLMIDYAFKELDCERVEFRADARNTQSRRAMEKLGAVYEGLLRNHTQMRDGVRRDTVYYSILKEEWL